MSFEFRDETGEVKVKCHGCKKVYTRPRKKGQREGKSFQLCHECGKETVHEVVGTEN